MDVNHFEDGYIIFEQTKNDVNLELTEELYEVVKNHRKIIKMIKSSSVKNDILQGYVIEQEGKPLQLMLDIKIQWNSL